MGAPGSFLFFFGGAKAVESVPAPSISYAGSPFSWWVYADTVSASVTNSGGSVTSYAVQAGSLPTGISLNTTTGAITGTATEDDYGAAQSVTIRATGPGGTSDAVISITVKNPTSVTGCWAWVDFNNIASLYQDSGKTTPVASDGDVIGAAEDRTGNGRDYTQGTASRRPTYQTSEINSLAVSEYDGTDDNLSGNSPNAVPATYVLVLQSLPGYTNYYTLFSPCADATASFEALVTPALNWDDNQATSGVVITGDHTSPIVVVLKFVDATELHIYVDGAEDGNSPLDPRTATGATAVLGASSAAGATAQKCQIAEYIVYNSALSDANRGLIEDYLGAKWGITVA